MVLVDEYDKPILDNIDNPSIAGEMREGLKNLYDMREFLIIFLYQIFFLFWVLIMDLSLRIVVVTRQVL